MTNSDFVRQLDDMSLAEALMGGVSAFSFARVLNRGSVTAGGTRSWTALVAWHVRTDG